MLTEKRKTEAISLIILICLAIVIYSNISHAPFQFDDDYYIVRNPNIKHLNELKAIWDRFPTRFITLLSLALNYRFGRLDTFGYHLFNLIIHICSAIMVWLIVGLTFRTPVMKNSIISKYSRPISLFTALIFLCHPVQTESVTYIWQRSTSLSGFFYLLTVFLYAKSRLSRKDILYILSFVVAAMGMLTKETIVTLPFCIILYEFCFFGHSSKNRRAYAYLPLLLISAIAFFFIKMDVQDPIKHSVLGNYNYLLTQLRVMITYLRLSFLPINQNVDYYYPIVKNALELPVLASIALLIIIAVVAIRSFSKYRLISFAIIWYFLTISLESGIILHDNIIFEHRLYLPLVGYSLFLVSALYYFLADRFRKEVLIMLIVIAIFYSGLTYSRNFVWADEITFWNDVIHKSPQKAAPYLDRGKAYYDNGMLDKAIADCGSAISIDPRLITAYINRANAYASNGVFDKALADYNKAIMINPAKASIYVNRGLTYANMGDIGKAVSDYNKAIKINPSIAEAYYNLGSACAAQKNVEGAILNYKKATMLDPDFFEAFHNLGNIYSGKGDYNAALYNFDKAIEAAPCFGRLYYSRAVVYLAKGEYDKSWDDLHKAVKLGYNVNPDFLSAIKKTLGSRR